MADRIGSTMGSIALRQIMFTLAIVSALSLAAPASAAVQYVGSWTVDQGPDWSGSPPNGPLAYTGQEAAALLFGGSASDYVISTVGTNVGDINNLAWYSVIGSTGNQGNGGSLLAQDYSSKYLGQYYGPTSGFERDNLGAAASAYVNDNALGSTFTNFAFRVTGVPEPSTWAMMLVGFGAIGASMRRRSRTSAQLRTA